jgi:hypothetical protein
MSFTFTNEYAFETATFDLATFQSVAEENEIPFTYERKIESATFYDWTFIKIDFSSKHNISEIAKLIPTPHELVARDDLDGELKTTTTYN